MTLTAVESPMESERQYTADEIMTVIAARQLRNGQRCFVGIGKPGVAANLARRTHAPEIILVYESGTIGAKPRHLPLSIGDGELAQTADFVVSVPEIFNYWLQGGRIDVGFLGAAQIDRFGNLNTTVIGEYDDPSVRLPGAGGAPEIAASAGEVIVIAQHARKRFVDRLDFLTSAGSIDGYQTRARLGLPGRGVTTVITDLGVLRLDPSGEELVLESVHPGVELDQVRAATGWSLQTAAALTVSRAPSPQELSALRTMKGAMEVAE
jgi:glutaconate CoA-transferase subunit B